MDDDELHDALREIVGPSAVAVAPDLNPDDLHDESLHPPTATPRAVVRPGSTAEVAALCRWASAHAVPLTARGSGTGLSGGASPVRGGVVVSFSRMNQLLHLDLDDHVAVVQPGITLRELNEALLAHALRYPVHPGELSGSLGGNVNTNAGGMRAVRHGVTRHHVIGLEAVLVDGTIVRTGGPVVKLSSGYDLTQLLIGSEGTLALVTEITLRLSPSFAHSATVLVPFATLEEVTRVVPSIVASGLEPSMTEYIDLVTMRAITDAASLELGVSPDVAAAATAYLVVVLETRTGAQLEHDLEDLAQMLEDAGALDIYVLAGGVAHRLIEARERMFWAAKAAGADDIVDVVVPRSKVVDLLGAATRLAREHGAIVTGCGHVGDGNVHLSVFQRDDERRGALLHDLFAYGLSLGGAISGEHGIGRDKQEPFLALSDPALIELQRRIKAVFDPANLLNPYRLLDDRPAP
ncbi:MAG: FAD-binding oxidoreductase [Acidimicrobiales bacterium]